MAFERACAVADVRTDEAFAAVVGEVEVAIARNDDEFFAIRDLCSHAEVSLSEGEVEDCQIECWLHGSRFDLRTGKPTSFPATEPVALFPVEVRPTPDGGADVYVDTTTTLNGVDPH